MKTQALRWMAAGVLSISSLLIPSYSGAEPLADLQARLATLRNDQPTRIKVDVELRHKGTAPLHLSAVKQRGEATVEYGPRGVKRIDQKWLGSSSRFSFWRKSKVETDMPLLDDVEAGDLINPAETLQLLLSDATLLSDENVEWQGRPARCLVIRPGMLRPASEGTYAKASTKEKDEHGPFTLEAKIWLDESGAPLAMERSMELRVALLAMTQHQAVTFQQVDGRLLVDEAWETYSGTALAVLRGKDAKRMKVTSVK